MVLSVYSFKTFMGLFVPNAFSRKLLIVKSSVCSCFGNFQFLFWRILSSILLVLIGDSVGRFLFLCQRLVVAV